MVVFTARIYLQDYAPYAINVQQILIEVFAQLMHESALFLSGSLIANMEYLKA